MIEYFSKSVVNSMEIRDSRHISWSPYSQPCGGVLYHGTSGPCDEGRQKCTLELVDSSI